MIIKFLIFFALLKGVISQNVSSCRKNYSLTCAEGWTKVLNKDECIAPISYTGPCSRILQIEHNTKRKIYLENECSIKWPCMIECEKNYTSQCPENWIPIDEKICEPSSLYTGSCLTPYDFSNMNNEQKEIWGNKCEVSWPCKEKCKKDYSKSCPQGWNRDNDGLCVAPKYYNGSCLSKASLFSLDKEMKIAFEKLCKVDFPCVKKCEYDVTNPCPKEWILLSSYETGNQVNCLPPNSYKGSCGRKTDFANLNTELINELLFQCDVEWSCSEDSENLINYDELCPEDWIQDSEYCVAPDSYVGSCSKRKLFGLFKKELKKEYAELCNVKWPLLKNAQKTTALRRRKNKYGAVEPTTGDVVSII